MKFPCKNDPSSTVDINHCFDCPDNMKCDTYASMLNETHPNDEE